MVMTPQEDKTETFAALRPYLVSVAYRLTGSVAEAEDIVQDAYLRWHRSDASEVRSAKAWLTAVVTRLGIDHLRSARVQREHYFGPWLPEPMVGEEVSETPERRLELADDLSVALLMVLERLGPEERAAFLLREAFDFGYEDIADVLQKNPAACRQMVKRARDRVASDKPRFSASSDEHVRLVQSFAHAVAHGDMDDLMALFSDSIVLVTDGGGKVKAAPMPVEGAQKVARFFVGIRGGAPQNAVQSFRMVNGKPGFVVMAEGMPFLASSFDVADGRIERIYVVRNPEKLAHLTGLAAG